MLSYNLGKCRRFEIFLYNLVANKKISEIHNCRPKSAKRKEDKADAIPAIDGDPGTLIADGTTDLGKEGKKKKGKGKKKKVKLSKSEKVLVSIADFN